MTPLSPLAGKTVDIDYHLHLAVTKLCSQLFVCWELLNVFSSADFFFKIIFLLNNQEYYQGVKKFESRSGLTKRRAIS